MSKSTQQCFKYRNNLIEQDHRFIKRHRIRSAGFHSLQAASAALSDVKIVHAIRKKARRAVSLIGFSVVDELETLIAA
ncbi:transposase [Lacticaseibacillus paracasei]|nr:transposase [Lacticaseibacillus paracasei]